MSILDQLDANRSEMTQLAAVPGVALAKVTNIQDPDKLDRVRCQLLTKNPEVKETNWAWVMSFMGGKGKILGVVIGGMIIGIINYGMTALMIPSSYQKIVMGALIIISVAIDHFVAKAKK